MGRNFGRTLATAAYDLYIARRILLFGGDYDGGGHDAAVRDFRIVLAAVIRVVVVMVLNSFVSDGGGTMNESQPAWTRDGVACDGHAMGSAEGQL